jgi:DNA-binding phage protein
MKDRAHENAMAELFRKDPAYAIELLKSVLKHGDREELRIVLRQIRKMEKLANQADQSDLDLQKLMDEALNSIEGWEGQ